MDWGRHLWSIDETPLVCGVQATDLVIVASGYMARLVAEDKLVFEVE